MELTERDWRILRGLEDWGLLGLGQLEGGFFGQGVVGRAELLFNERWRHKGVAYRRLRKLEKAGLVRAHRTAGHARVYGLSERGHRLLSAAGRAELRSPLLEPNPWTLEHRLTAAGVGLLLKAFHGLEVRTERQMWQHQFRQKRHGELAGDPLVPDLVVWPGGSPCAIEVELNQKADRRYRLLWARYRRQWPAETKVLYLVPSRLRAVGLQVLARGLGTEQVYALELAAFRSSLGRAAFVNGQGSRFSLARPAEAEEKGPEPVKPALKKAMKPTPGWQGSLYPSDAFEAQRRAYERELREAKAAQARG